VAERLRARHEEIEEATRARVFAVSEPAARADPEYSRGLEAAVAAALEHGLAALEWSEERTPEMPPVLLTQARLAAHAGVSLDTVLRRYFAGYTLLGDFVIQEAERTGLMRGAQLQRLLRSQAALFDQVVAAVSEEYSRAKLRAPQSPEQRKGERVERLLAGQLLDAADLGYDLTGHHLGVVARGPGANQVLRHLAEALDRRLLLVSRGKESVWAWLGGRRPFDAAGDLIPEVESESGISVALGEPGEGLAGWRLSHRQARAAMVVALRRADSVVRYADVALLSSVFTDELLRASLHQLYLEPLSHERDGGKVARDTLRAYFAAGGNISSAAAALAVKRHTVTSRLRGVEVQMGRSLDECAIELDMALQLSELEEAHLSRRDLAVAY